MAGLEADTSSYKQPLPVGPLETAKNVAATRSAIQGNISNDISIDKQKLELMNTQFTLMNQELSTMIDDPSMTKEKAAQKLNNFATTLKMPPEAVNHMMQELQAAPSVKAFSENALRRGMSVQERINQQYGTAGSMSNGATDYQGVQQPASKGGGFVPATQSAIQPPPTQQNVDTRRNLPTGQPNPDYLQPGIVGAAAAPGFVPVPQARPNTLPVQPLTSGPTGPTVRRTDMEPASVTSRIDAAFPQRIATGAAPGVAGAIAQVGEQSGKDYSSDLTKAKNFQSDLYPSQRVLEIVKNQGEKAFGPGTEGLNSLKSALVTWLPNVDQKTIDSVSDYEQAKKYLVQAARSNGSTGTNDQLAAAFEANPNVKMSGATIENVVKSNIALRKMQHAQTLLFGQQNLPPSEYSQWISKNQNALDPRAFGFDIMDDNAKAKLLESMASKDKSGNWIAKKGKDKEFQKFEQSLSFANDAGLIEPPGRR